MAEQRLRRLVVFVPSDEVARRCAGLFSGTVGRFGSAWTDGSVVWLPVESEAWCTVGSLASRTSSPVAHGFLGAKRGLVRAADQNGPDGLRIAFDRPTVYIDGPARMNARRLDVASWNLSKKAILPALPLRVAAFVRRQSTASARNTPRVFGQTLLQLQSEGLVRVTWCGDVSVGASGVLPLWVPDGLSRDDIVASSWSYHGKTFLEQIQHLGHRFDAAIGVNSGGLDLASAARLPTLRFFERFPKAPWHHDFNSYLANALNLGLCQGHPDEFEPAMRAFVELVRAGMGVIPLHSIFEPEDRVVGGCVFHMGARVWRARVRVDQGGARLRA